MTTLMWNLLGENEGLCSSCSNQKPPYEYFYVYIFFDKRLASRSQEKTQNEPLIWLLYKLTGTVTASAASKKKKQEQVQSTYIYNVTKLFIFHLFSIIFEMMCFTNFSASTLRLQLRLFNQTVQNVDFFFSNGRIDQSCCDGKSGWCKTGKLFL